jgi:nucleoside-diphosphate-sugar epimerase
MIYMPDAIRATIELMDAPAEQVKIRSAYNVAGVSFNPRELAAAITRAVPDFKIGYKPDSRQRSPTPGRKAWTTRRDRRLGLEGPHRHRRDGHRHAGQRRCPPGQGCLIKRTPAIHAPAWRERAVQI